MRRECQTPSLFSTSRPIAQVASALYFTDRGPGLWEDCEDSLGSSEPDSPTTLPRADEKRSALSRLSINLESFFEILENRAAHDPFEEPPDGQTWFYRDETGEDFGPLPAAEMNRLFQGEHFSEAFMFRVSGDNRLLSFDQVLKRYYKRRNPQMLTALPPKKFAFDPLAEGRPRASGLQSHQSLARNTRIFSDQVRPTFAFQVKPDALDLETSDGEDLMETRGRSTTFSN